MREWPPCMLATFKVSLNSIDEGILPTEVTDDIPQEHFKHLMNSFYRTKVAITEEKAKLIERQTRNQADDELWKSERR